MDDKSLFNLYIFHFRLQNLNNKNHEFNFKNLHLFTFDFQIDLSFCI